MNQQSNNRISIMRDEPVAASLMKLGINAISDWLACYFVQ